MEGMKFMTDGSVISCPKCQHSFPLNAAIAQPLIDRLRGQYEEQATKDMAEMEQKLAAKDRKLVEAEQAELKLRQEKSEFEEQKRAFDLEMARQAELVKEAIRKEKDEEFRLKEAEANAKLDAMKR